MEIYLVIIGGIAAVFFGAFLAKKQANAFSNHSHSSKSSSEELPSANHFDYGDMRFLHLGTPTVQGSMKLSRPYDIHLEYVQRMMGWLLFADLDKVHELHAMQLGLGASSLTKFCYKHLCMQTTAIELNPNVIETCRLWFNLPEDDSRLNVILGDALDAVVNEAWLGKIDALQVDLSDQDAKLPSLDSESFYADCKQLLTDTGCMTVNLFGSKANIQSSIRKITLAFGNEAMWIFKPTKANTIVMAMRTPYKQDRNKLSAQAQIIESRWPLPAKKWLKALKWRQTAKPSCL